MEVAANSELEDQIFDAFNNPKVSQATFNTLLRQWVQEAAPDMVGRVIGRGGHEPDVEGLIKQYQNIKGFDPEKYRQDMKRKKQNPENTTHFLSGQYTPTLGKIASHRRDEYGFSGLGLIVQPYTAHYLRTEIVKKFDSIGIDNGMFEEAGQNNFTWDKYEKMVKVALAQEKRGYLDKLNFFTVPDQPFDWKTTLRKFEAFAGDVKRLRGYGAPVAICIQNGATPATVPWDDIDVIFIGGNNKFKTGPEAKAIVNEGRLKGKTVHMGRVNTPGRFNTASDWGVETADGTYLTHEMAKSLHEIERRNPQKPGETFDQYNQRLKRILHGEHGPNDIHPQNTDPHYTEPEITQDFVQYVVDNQQRNWFYKRYRAIAGMIRPGQPLNRLEIMEMDHFLPHVPYMQPDEDVVEYDDDGNVVLDRRGQPVVNPYYSAMLREKMTWREMPPGIPFNKEDPSVYTKYIKRYINQMRQRGVMSI
jgi:hypothetical protein